MVVHVSGNEASFTFQMAGIDFHVLEFSLTERISAPFDLELTLASKEDVGFSAALGSEALFSIIGRGEERYVHGMAIRFEKTGAIKEASHTVFNIYRVSVAPALWGLSLECDCRIFQEKSVQQIVGKVLEEGGVAPDSVGFALQIGRQPRDYCVQYRETDLDFVSRLLEEEGIFYYFEHRRDVHFMILGDSEVNYRPIPGDPDIVFNPPDGMATDEDCVFEFRRTQRLATGVCTVRDFNFEKPSLDLTCANQASFSFRPEAYDYPGLYRLGDRGSMLAKVRLQEAVACRDAAEGRSDCPRLAPGYFFNLENHELEEFNRDYLVVEAFHTGTQGQVLQAHALGDAGFSYENRFVAIPADTTFRPERNTPRPVVEGVQTAIVTGPEGAEIYTDDYGRIKVQFHWDREGKRNENSSCWIRTSQIWAGPRWGSVYIPRVGHEVIVDFLEGDPDRPIVTGSVYNGANPPPYPLPDEKTKSTLKSDSTRGGGGFNELMFDDAKGSEEVYIHAQKDWTIAVENDKTQAVGRNEQLRVMKNRTKSVGGSQSESVGGNKSITVGGAHNETIAKDAKITVVEGSFTHDVQTSFAEYHVKGPVREQYDSTQSTLVANDVDIESTGGHVHLKASTQIELAVGESKLTLKSDGSVSLEGKNIVIGISENSVASTVSLKALSISIGASDYKVEAGSISSKASGEHLISGSEVDINT